MKTRTPFPGPVLGAVSVVLIAAVLAAPVRADVVQLVPVKDNSIYEDGGGALSNGAGARLFAGVTRNDDVIRSLLAFDVAGSVPAGSVIQSATLTLNVSLEPSGNTSAHTFTLHRVSADWGEGASDAGDAGGTGASAAPGDATWLHTFFDTGFWTNDGGDFDAAPSASQSVGPGLGSVAFDGPGLAADVQAWLDAPAGSFGWVIRGDETETGNARRFDSKDHSTPALRPMLEIEYVPAAPALPVWARLVAGLAIGATGMVVARASRRAGSRAAPMITAT